MVFAGNFWKGSTEHGLSAGFQREGWIVREIEQKDFLATGSTLPEKALARLTARIRAERYEEAVLSTLHHLQPNVLFTVKGANLSRRLFEAAYKMGIQTICFWPDYHFDYKGVDIEGLLASSLFITSKSFQMPWLAERRPAGCTAFIAHGYDPDAHAPILRTVTETDYTADIRYVGNHSPAKQRWIEGLYEALPNAKLQVVGNRWSQALSHPMASRLVEARAYIAADYALAVQTAHINVAIHWGKASNGWEDLTSTRTFEIPACGGFMLHIDNDEVREYFDVGTEIDVFSDIEELADKCRFYLAHDETRRRMAQKAHERAVPAYSYHARAREIVELINA
ncbi:glycosyltransferase [Aestuariicoccus sp. MJ-SS9]|uniref:CgeB family protein n=1 Tax=Aestuariicoccus sp. MJ-SS9 TaxID=3079855 RepID=UPI00290D63BD|nr:glycosyltransferase [Aestuariicoccus sp. MJ-SS9]MDU8913523.1 glycosyltransferase [Aestuariicoccus sp. MJ-SS9]